MDITLVLSTVIAVLIASFLGFLFWLQRKEHKRELENANNNKGNVSLQLQAYERLTLLIDRIALPNLIARVNEPGLSVKEMQLLLYQNIKHEFDYNITQQIYVSKNAWDAVKNLKEQNMLIINQLANLLPANATGLDLNKLLLEYTMNDAKGNIHEVVSEVLSYEAKKLL
ncbi:MAG: hypothetical protein JSR09_00570 [Bacteroidetes bacterium]|nr:hypothetical protein [Bacteroidota bacterium]MBS1648177.1 hypothetical protein [Bacteroidota bacterium]